MHYNHPQSHSPTGFGSNNYKERFDEQEMRLSNYRIWKKLYMPKHTLKDPENPYRIVYSHHTEEDLMREQMARRMDRKVIKLETAYGSERQAIVVKRNQDLIVQDVMEDIQRIFKIPMNEQVIFHKGTNLSDFPGESLENLGVENNHTIRLTRDPDLPNRSPRPIARNPFTVPTPGQQQQQQPYMMMNGQNSMPPMMNGGGGYNSPRQQPQYTNGYNGYTGGFGLDPVSYLKEIAPSRVPDPTPYQMQVYNNPNANNSNQPNDVLKLYVSYGSEREYILVRGKKPLCINDLKLELNRVFKISPEQQCVVFKGYNLHEYMDEAPLEAFGMENNSPISVWPRSSNANNDVRLPARGPTPPPNHMANQLADAFASPRPQLSNRWDPPQISFAADGAPAGEVVKIEIQHGSDRHQLIIKGKPTLTVLDLQSEIERLTAVPIRDQKLFFKSQQLEQTPYKTLRECEVENNNIIKLIGEPSKIRYSNYFGRMPIIPPNPNDPNAQVFGGGQQQPQQPQQNNNVYQPNYSQNY